MKQKEEISLNDIFNNNKKYVFFTGAGISRNSPSNIPLANELKEILYNNLVPQSEINTINSIPSFRFELLIQQIQEFFDRDLKLFDYFELNKNPNLIHFFISQSIINGHGVITTNFDYLLECALFYFLDQKDRYKIRPIITQNDFENYNNTKIEEKSNSYYLIKIHGSKKNNITQENTSESLITTLKRIGKIYSQQNSLGLESYKILCLRNMIKGKTLVLMGYSGSDDFDIIPAFKKLNEMNDIVWICHSNDAEINISQVNISNQNFQALSFLPENIQELFRLFCQKNKNITIIKGNTYNLINEIYENEYIFKKNKKNIDFKDSLVNTIEFSKWISNFFLNVDQIRKIHFTCSLYRLSNEFDKLLELSFQGLKLLENEENNKMRIIFLHYIGISYFNLGNYKDALHNYKMGLDFLKTTPDISLEIPLKGDIAYLYFRMGELDRSYIIYKKILEIELERENYDGIFADYSAISMILETWGRTEELLDIRLKSVEIARKIGDFDKIYLSLSNLAGIYQGKADFSNALPLFEESLKICELLGDIKGQITVLNNISTLYMDKKDFVKAEEYINKAYLLLDENNYIQLKSFILNTKGQIYLICGKFQMAKKFLEDAIENDNLLHDNIAKVVHLTNLSDIYRKEGKLEETLKLLGDAYKISKEHNYIKGFIGSLNAIAITHINLGDKDGAIIKVKEALEFALKLENPSEIINETLNLANILVERNEIDESFKILNDLSKRVENFDLRDIKMKIYESYGNIYLRINQFNKGFEYLDKSIRIADEINDNTVKIDILLNVAESYINYGNNECKEQGKNLVLQVQNLIQSYPNIRNLARSKRLLGKYYEFKAKYVMALNKYFGGLELIKNNGFKSDLPIFYNHIGYVYLIRRKFEEALEYFNLNLELTKKLENKIETANAYYNIGTCYFGKRNFKNSIQNLKIAKKLYHECGFTSKEGDIIKIIQICLSKMSE